ncbi:hypothetical protein B566_EDAN006858 [Ephemera danica]|nr:hypothetical protein B566_EDAN006858 [Ephemera danica]
MYVLKKLSSVVRITPDSFNVPKKDAITSELNKKLANKVLHNVGLCVSLYDILSIGDSYIIPGDGSSNMKVTFRYIVFRPFVNEAIVGKVKLCDSEGIHVTLTFFDDILIPKRHMPDNSYFNPAQRDEIRFKVVQLEFNDTTPTPADHAQHAVTDSSKQKPFRIIGRTNDPGLGLSSWWVSPDEAEEAEEEEEEEGDEDEESVEEGG